MKTKKLLSVLLALCLAFALLPGPALAEGTTVIASYAALAKAFEPSSNVITVTSNITITGEVGTFESKNSIKVNSGVTVTVAKGGSLISGIENNGTITVEAGGTLASTQGARIVNNGTITINAGEGSVLPGRLTLWMGGDLDNKGTLTMSGELVTDYYVNEDGSYKEPYVKNSESGTATCTGKIFIGNVPTGNGELSAMMTTLRGVFGNGEYPVVEGAPIYTAAELYAALEASSYWDSYHIMAELTVTQSCVDFTKNLTIDGFHGSLTVSGNVVFAPEWMGGYYFEVVKPEGAEKGALTAQNGATVGLVTGNYGGTITVKANSEVSFENGENGGTITVENGGTLSTAQGMTLENSGTINVAQGGTLWSVMGSTIENATGGSIVVDGTFNISDPGDWSMLGKYKDEGGTITGAGTINIANCDLCVDAIDSTFTGTVNSYAASVKTQELLNTALNDNVFITNVGSDVASKMAQTFTISEPTVVKGKALILFYGGSQHQNDGWVSNSPDATSYNYRNVELTGNGSLTLINSTFTMWMEGSKYAVGIDLNGGTLTNWTPFPHLTSAALAETSKSDLTLPTPTRDGYAFAGWTLSRFGQADKTVPAGSFDITDSASGYSFTAQWYIPGGGVVTTPEAVTVTDEKGGVSATAEVKGGTAELEIGKEALDAVSGDVSVDLSGLKEKVTGAALPAGTVEKLAEKAGSLTIGLTDSSVTLDADVLATAKAAGGDVTLSVTEYDKGRLSQEARDIIGSQPVYELTLEAGSTQLHELGGRATVSLPYTPKAGETPEYVVIWRMVDNVPQPIACKYDPATGRATFDTATFSLYVVGYFPFKDVPADKWYYGSAVYAYTKGLMQGVGDDAFAPEDRVTRAMLVTILHRLEGQPAVTAKNAFTDVPEGKWYTDAVVWASSAGIIDGYGGGLFGPGDRLTREQMVTVLRNYARYKGAAADASGDLSAFSDASAVSQWAADAMGWACGQGIIRGDGGSLAPQADSSRAQVAAVLERFISSALK